MNSYIIQQQSGEGWAPQRSFHSEADARKAFSELVGERRLVVKQQNGREFILIDWHDNAPKQLVPQGRFPPEWWV